MIWVVYTKYYYFYKSFKQPSQFVDTDTFSILEYLAVIVYRVEPSRIQKKNNNNLIQKKKIIKKDKKIEKLFLGKKK